MLKSPKFRKILGYLVAVGKRGKRGFRGAINSKVRHRIYT